MCYETYDHWNVLLVTWSYVPRFDCVVYFQFPIDCQ